MIKQDILKKYKQAATELGKELKTGKFKALKPERAFVDWYVKARFGDLPKSKIFDGKKDGGVDVTVDNNDITFVLQSKYEVTAKVSLVKRTEIGAFENLARKFTNPESEHEFSGWLATVKPEFRSHYQKVREKALKNPKNVRFVFITSKRNEYGEDELYEVEDIQNISALWYLYSEGFTPPTEFIDLALDNAWFTPSNNGRYKTYVGLADVKTFLRLMKDDENERLFAQNVRTNLHSKVNGYIRNTYEEEPDVFWLCNNGVYIVCKKVTSSGNQYHLTYPSVINGSQTLHAIAESNKNHSCKILVRILEMDILGDPNLLSAVVRRTNTQNAMKLINLFAHDSVQLNIATYLDRFKIFYERREKEWKNERKLLLSDYVPVNLKDVAQWLSTAEPTIGLGTARNQVATLFDENNYQRIFGNFGKNFQTSAYEKLVLIVWAGFFINHTMRHLPKKIRNYGKISHLLLIRTIFEAIQQSTSLENEMGNLLKEHRFGRMSVPRSVQKLIREIITKSIALQKKEQTVNPKVDYSNFFKRNDLTNLAYSKICTPTLIKKLAHGFVKGINQIQ